MDWFSDTHLDLNDLTAKEIALLPASVLGPIIRQGHLDSGANPVSDADLKKAIDVVRRGHWAPGLPRHNPTQEEINDLF